MNGHLAAKAMQSMEAGRYIVAAAEAFDRCGASLYSHAVLKQATINGIVVGKHVLGEKAEIWEQQSGISE